MFFTKISMAGTGWIVLAIVGVLNLFGLEADEGTVAGVVEAVATIAGFVLALYGQVRRSDLELGILRK